MNENVIPSDKIKFFYLRDNKNMPHVTIAWYYDRTSNQVFFQHATKHKNDSFNRSLGRHIAAQRLQVRPFTVPVSVQEPNPLREINAFYAAQLDFPELDLNPIPTRVSRLANAWLKRPVQNFPRVLGENPGDDSPSFSLP